MSADRSRSGPAPYGHPSRPASPAVSSSSGGPSPAGGTDTGTGPAEPTAAEARTALEALDADAAHLAGRFVTPRWYQVLIAAAVALMLCALIIPRVHPASVVPLLVIWSPTMLFVATRQHGVAATHRAGRRSRRAMLRTFAVLGVLLVIAVLLKTSALSSWLILLPALGSFVAVLLLSRHYDAAVRSEVADPDEAR